MFRILSDRPTIQQYILIPRSVKNMKSHSTVYQYQIQKPVRPHLHEAALTMTWELFKNDSFARLLVKNDLIHVNDVDLWTPDLEFWQCDLKKTCIKRGKNKGETADQSWCAHHRWVWGCWIKSSDLRVTSWPWIWSFRPQTSRIPLRVTRERPEEKALYHCKTVW